MNIQVVQDEKEMCFAVPASQYKVKEAHGKLTKVDEISYIQSINWGPNHLAFVDKKNRLFTMGHNRGGKTGLGQTIKRDHVKKFQRTADREELNVGEDGEGEDNEGSGEKTKDENPMNQSKMKRKKSEESIDEE